VRALTAFAGGATPSSPSVKEKSVMSNESIAPSGCTATRLRNRHDTQDYWTFSHNNVGCIVYLRGKNPPTRNKQTCVSMVTIGAY